MNGEGEIKEVREDNRWREVKERSQRSVLCAEDVPVSKIDKSSTLLELSL